MNADRILWACAFEEVLDEACAARDIAEQGSDDPETAQRRLRIVESKLAAVVAGASYNEYKN